MQNKVVVRQVHDQTMGNYGRVGYKIVEIRPQPNGRTHTASVGWETPRKMMTAPGTEQDIENKRWAERAAERFRKQFYG